MPRAISTILGLAMVGLITAPAQANEAVEAREAAFYRAFLEADGAAMEEIFAEDFLYQHGSGSDFTEAAFVELIGGGTAVVTRADPPEMQIRDFGDTVVTHGAGIVEGRIGEQPFGGTLRFVNVWHRDAGVWRLHHRNSQFVE